MKVKYVEVVKMTKGLSKEEIKECITSGRLPEGQALPEGVMVYERLYKWKNGRGGRILRKRYYLVDKVRKCEFNKDRVDKVRKDWLKRLSA